MENGTCYRDAFDLFFKLIAEQGERVVLVHGYPRLIRIGSPLHGVKYGHAWIEIGREVIDAKFPEKRIPKPLYYGVGKIKEAECVRYSSLQEVVNKSLELEHYGPWERVPEDATFGSE